MFWTVPRHTYFDMCRCGLYHPGKYSDTVFLLVSFQDGKLSHRKVMGCINHSQEILLYISLTQFINR